MDDYEIELAGVTFVDQGLDGLAVEVTADTGFWLTTEHVEALRDWLESRFN